MYIRNVWIVLKIISKFILQFLVSGFVVMLFHYDGVVDKWRMFEWSDHVIHVSAPNQTKWYIFFSKSIFRMCIVNLVLF